MARDDGDIGVSLKVAWPILAIGTVAFVAAIWVGLGLTGRNNVEVDRQTSVPTKTLEFGLGRDAISRRVVINLCGGDQNKAAKLYPNECPTPGSEAPVPVQTPGGSPAPRPDVLAASLSSDLEGESNGRQFPADQISVTAENSGRQGLLVTLQANPQVPTQVPDGRYRGQVVVEREQYEPAVFDVVANLEARAGYPTAAALLCLIGGAALGGFAKWLNDFISPLAVQHRRWRRVERRLRGYRFHLPRDAGEQLKDIGDAIRAGDGSEVSESLDALKQDRGALVSFARLIASLKRQVKDQQGQIDDSIQPRLRFWDSALAVERELIKDLRERNWPWSEPQKIIDDCQRAKDKMRFLTSQIRDAVGDLTTERKERLEAFFSQVARGGPNWLTGTEEFQEAQPALAASRRGISRARRGEPSIEESEAEQDSVDPVEAQESVRQKKRPELTAEERKARRLEWILNQSSSLTSLFTAGVVVVVGYLTQFADNVGFQGGRGDYLKLFGWAFAAQVTGVTVIEMAGRLKGPVETAPK